MHRRIPSKCRSVVSTTNAVHGCGGKAGLGEIQEGLPEAGAQVSPRHQSPANKRAEERFKQISEAYDVLSDADRRRKHHREQEYGRGCSGARGAPLASGSRAGGRIRSVIWRGGHGLSSFFSEIFRPPRRKAREERGRAGGRRHTRA